jgi:hypothetical protein
LTDADPIFREPRNGRYQLRPTNEGCVKTVAGKSASLGAYQIGEAARGGDRFGFGVLAGQPVREASRRSEGAMQYSAERSVPHLF